MWLKRSPPQNIVIGGAAGAFPPMIGWACVTNSVTIESTVLFLIIFLWTPAHFWALALFKMRDYEAVGVPMLPNVAGERVTKHQIVAYAVLTAVCAVLPSFLGFASFGYGLVAAALGAIFIYCSIAVWRMAMRNWPSKKPRSRLFFSVNKDIVPPAARPHQGLDKRNMLPESCRSHCSRGCPASRRSLLS